MKELKSNINQYGLEFLIEEKERSVLAQLLNKLAVLIRKNPLVPECSFVNVDSYTFFEHENK